ncbi:MAG: UDP-N-acetylmuramate--L-alanine ligase [Burkholderiales bacterium]|jgi:UDP-N-acetylmuramate--alanine ligase|nr:UDP-N-acetylmuramate--L-alanine ligase [Burkholderiales bacterium]MCE1176054.1 UDP-N-acetylmuramate--L-alanine ligase [Burkholderiales bacterium]
MKHRIENIHFVGIGGAGMSGIAEVLLNLDYKITGSDVAENANVKRLRSLGASVALGHAEENVQNADVLVVSTAIDENNPEILAARMRKIPIVPRAVMLAELMRFKRGIGIAGTHGKTTTTSLVASVMGEGGLDPTFVIGGKLNSAGVNARLGKGDYIVAEADESDASFLHLSVTIAVITNIDQDHMDTYDHDFNKLKEAFVAFTRSLPFYGAAIVCIDDANVREIVPKLSKTVITYGLSEDANVRAYDVQDAHGQMKFKVARTGFGEDLPDLDVTLNLPGLHNVRNALAAIAVGTEVDVDDAAICKALAEFNGVGRRFQRYGQVKVAEANGGGQFTLIDDYGHHPVEMAATLAAARGAFPNQRIVLAFQPHRYTRTRDCFEDFVKVLSGADGVILTEVYAASESPIVAADGRSLARALRVAGKVEPVFVEEISSVPQAIADFARNGDVVICMGAGSIGAVAGKTVELMGQA